MAVPARTPAGYVLVLLGAFTPGTVAIALTAWKDGRAGVGALLGRIRIVDAPVRCYVFALSYMVAIKISAAVLHRVLLGAWPRVDPSLLLTIPAAIAISTPFQAGEEVGWRGYVLPRLAARMGLARASLVLGVIWAGWHLPQFYIADGDTYHQSFVIWAASVVAMSVAFAWLYVRSGGSLLLVMLLHAAVNNSKDIVPSGRLTPPGVFSLSASPVAWLTMGLLWVFAAYLLVRISRERADGASEQAYRTGGGRSPGSNWNGQVCQTVATTSRRRTRTTS